MAKLNREAFVTNAVEKLRGGKAKGISTHAAGFQEAFRLLYGDKADLMRTLGQMQKAGKIIMRANGKPNHYMIYLPNEAPPAKRTGEAVLAMLGARPKRVVHAS